MYVVGGGLSAEIASKAAVVDGEDIGGGFWFGPFGQAGDFPGWGADEDESEDDQNFHFGIMNGNKQLNNIRYFKKMVMLSPKLKSLSYFQVGKLKI